MTFHEDRINEVSRRSGLRSALVKELFSSGYTFYQKHNQPVSWVRDALLLVEPKKSEKEMIDEYFVPVEGFPLYEISNLGRVVNIVRDTDVKPTSTKDGFQKITLSNNGRRSTFLIHRLVAQAFFLNYRDQYEVELVNGDRSDCTVANIHIGSRRRRGKGRI